MLKLAIPKGSLEKKTFWIFEKAGLQIRRGGERNYSLTIDDLRISEVILLRPQEIPEYIASGDFDIGITGLDWVVERGLKVIKVADLRYSRQGWNKVKIVLASDNSDLVKKVGDISEGSRVFTEYPNITHRFFNKTGKKMSIKLSYGATEGKVPRLARYFVDITETGKTLEANGKKILAIIMESSTYFIANSKAWQDPIKRQMINEIRDLLFRIVLVQDKILIKFNVDAGNLDKVIGRIPAMEEPTVSKLSSGKKYAVESVVPQSQLNTLITDLKKLGAKDILEIELKGLIP